MTEVSQADKITWVIGDIHGMYDPLRALISQLDNEYLDKFIFVGDLMDHGPSAKAVLDLILGLGDKAITLLGNHEYLLLETLFNEEFQERWGNRIWEENGAEATVRAFGCNDIDELRAKLEPRYVNFLHNLGCFHVERFGDAEHEVKFLITHGGVTPKASLAEQMAVNNYVEHNQWLKAQKIWVEDSFLWIRGGFFAADPNLWDDYIVIHGHTPTHLLKYSISPFDDEKDLYGETAIYLRPHPEDEDRIVSIDIDTGAAFGKRLTALGLQPSALKDGWFEIDVLQLNVQQGYYRTSPIHYERIRVKAVPIAATA
ncbi:MAG: metallophosphoesterase [Caldilineaceae bacterium]